MKLKILLILIIASISVSAQYTAYNNFGVQRQIVGSDTTYRWVGSGIGNYFYGKSISWYKGNFVPYTGATSNLNLGIFNGKASSWQSLDPTNPTGNYAEYQINKIFYKPLVGSGYNLNFPDAGGMFATREWANLNLVQLNPTTPQMGNTKFYSTPERYLQYDGSGVRLFLNDGTFSNSGAVFGNNTIDFYGLAKFNGDSEFNSTMFYSGNSEQLGYDRVLVQSSTPDFLGRVGYRSISSLPFASKNYVDSVKSVQLSTIASMVSYSGLATMASITDPMAGGDFDYIASGSGLTADGGTLIPATGKGGGFWRRRNAVGMVNAEWFIWNADGSPVLPKIEGFQAGTPVSVFMQKAIDSRAQHGGQVIINGYYNCEAPLIVGYGTYLKGASTPINKSYSTSADSTINYTGLYFSGNTKGIVFATDVGANYRSGNVTIENLAINTSSTASGNYALYATPNTNLVGTKTPNESRFINCYFGGAENAVRLEGADSFTFTNCRFAASTVGVYIDNTSITNNFIGCNFAYNTTGILNYGSETVISSGSEFEGSPVLNATTIGIEDHGTRSSFSNNIYKVTGTPIKIGAGANGANINNESILSPGKYGLMVDSSAFNINIRNINIRASSSISPNMVTGIYVRKASQIVIENNTVYGGASLSSYALRIDTSTVITERNNTVVGTYTVASIGGLNTTFTSQTIGHSVDTSPIIWTGGSGGNDVGRLVRTVGVSQSYGFGVGLNFSIIDRTTGNLQLLALGQESGIPRAIIGADASGTGAGLESILRGGNASGSNQNAGALRFRAGRPTGTGASGGISFQTAVLGASGTTLQTFEEKVNINQSGLNLSANARIGIAGNYGLSLQSLRVNAAGTAMEFFTALDATTAGTKIRTTASGTGAATTISIPHGLSGVTTNSWVSAMANNSAAAGISFVTVDATNVNIIYTVAPVSGTNNLIYSIEVRP